MITQSQSLISRVNVLWGFKIFSTAFQLYQAFVCKKKNNSYFLAFYVTWLTSLIVYELMPIRKVNGSKAKSVQNRINLTESNRFKKPVILVLFHVDS